MKKLLLTMLLVLKVLTFINGQYFKETEPNNSFATANLFQIPVTLIDSFESAFDVDYFRMYMPKCGVINLTINSIGMDQSTELFVYDSNFETISSSKLGNIQEFKKHYLLPAGTVYFKLSEYKQKISPKPFAISLSLDTSDNCECNNSFNTACPVESNAVLYPQIYGENNKFSGYDEDYYKLETSKAGVLSVKVSNVPKTQKITLTTFNKEQVETGATFSPTKGEGFKYDLLIDKGTHYLRLNDFYGFSDSAHFKISLNLDTTDICEINNSLDFSCLIYPNTTIYPQIYGENYTLGGKDVEYYKLILDKCGVVTFNLTNLSPQQQLQMFVYDSVLNVVGHRESKVSGMGYSMDLLLSGGTSYITLKDINSRSDSNHLKLQLMLDTTDICECNNLFESACSVNIVDTIYPQILGFTSEFSYDEDYFTLENLTCSRECIKLTEVPEGVTLSLEIYDSMFNLLSSEKASGSGEELNLCLDLGAGTYYYKLFGANETSDHGHVKMIFENTPGWEAPLISQLDLTLLSTPGINYQWYLNDTILPGETAQTINVKENGYYIVVITDNMGCTISSLPFHFTSITTIDDLKESELLIYPNPSNGHFSISSVEPVTSLKLINSLGQECYYKTNSNTNYFVENRGIYIAIIKTESQTIFKKLIVK